MNTLRLRDSWFIPIFFGLFIGTLYAFSYPPWNWPSLQFLVWILAFSYSSALLNAPSLNAQNLKRVLLFSFCFQTMIGIVAAPWITHAASQYGNLPYGVSVLVWFLYALTGQLHIPAYFYFRQKWQTHLQHHSEHLLSKKPWLVPLFFALVFTGLDQLNPKLFADTPGHVFIHWKYFKQIAEWGGPSFLTFILIASTESISLALSKLLKNGSHNTAHTPGDATTLQATPLRLLLPALILIPGTFLYGYLRVQNLQSALQAQDHSPNKTLKLGVAQANIGDFVKVASEQGNVQASETVINTYSELTQELFQNQQDDAVVWPETAYPTLFGKPRYPAEKRMEERVYELAQSPLKTLIFGGYDQNQDFEDFNSLFFLSHQGKSLEVYHKSLLLPFGETLPGFQYFPKIKKLFPMMGFFGRGPGPQSFKIFNANQEPFLAAASICYEGVDVIFNRKATQNQEDFFINVTNDSWFGPQGEPDMHLAFTQFRSIENRIPYVRATNTGYSVLVDEFGEIKAKTSLFNKEALSVEIHKRIDTFRVPKRIYYIWLHSIKPFSLLVLLYTYLLFNCQNFSQWIKRKKN